MHSQKTISCFIPVCMLYLTKIFRNLERLLPMKKLTDNRTFSIFMLMTVCMFYLFFAFFDGAVICVDSPGYIGMSIAREPAYPIFLAFLRSIFTHFDPDLYLTVAAVLQSLLAAFSAWSFASYLLREYQISRLLSLAILYTPPPRYHSYVVSPPKEAPCIPIVS